MKTGKKERVPKNGREQGKWGKMLKGAGSLDPPLTKPQKSMVRGQSQGHRLMVRGQWSEVKAMVISQSHKAMVVCQGQG